jgi:acylphosphatase
VASACFGVAEINHPTLGIIRAMEHRVARRVIVHGRVQGVWFRDTARHEALARGVAGWVRNRSDGSVQAWFEGPPEGVDAMIDWCRGGPPRARVERVEVSEGEPQGLREFEGR